MLVPRAGLRTLRFLALQALETVRASFWAIPLGMMGLAVALAATTRALDVAGVVPGGTPWFGASDSEAVRAVLGGVGNGMLGVLGIAFSVTVTTLVLASQQFGPHVLRNYMDKRFVQCVLGALAGTSLYCTLSLHLSTALPGEDGLGATVTVLTALALGALDLVLLVVFIHHTANALRVDAIITDIHDGARARLDALRSRRAEGDRPAVRTEDGAFERAAVRFAAPRSGYLAAIDRPALVAFAREHDLAMRVRYAPGAHVLKGAPLAEAIVRREDATAVGSCAAAATALERAVTLAFERHLAVGAEPTPEQDSRFAVRQLVQIALRALSPALNDPFTAMSCVDRLAAVLSALLERPPSGGWYADEEGVPRLLEPSIGNAELIAFAFDRIRVAAAGRSDVADHLVATFDALAERHDEPSARTELERQRRLLAARLDENGELAADRADVERRLGEAARVDMGTAAAERAAGASSG